MIFWHTTSSKKGWNALEVGLRTTQVITILWKWALSRKNRRNSLLRTKRWGMVVVRVADGIRSTWSPSNYFIKMLKRLDNWEFVVCWPDRPFSPTEMIRDETFNIDWIILQKKKTLHPTLPINNFATCFKGIVMLQVSAQAKINVTLVDQSDEILKKGHASIEKNLRKIAKKKFAEDKQVITTLSIFTSQTISFLILHRMPISPWNHICGDVPMFSRFLCGVTVALSNCLICWNSHTYAAIH